jgi:transcriptional regulator with XRE-family HTH domain
VSAPRLAKVRHLCSTGTARLIRQGAHLSLAEMAGEAGVASPSTVLRWERGERMPRGEPALRYLETLEQIARQA